MKCHTTLSNHMRSIFNATIQGKQNCNKTKKIPWGNKHWPVIKRVCIEQGMAVSVLLRESGNKHYLINLLCSADQIGVYRKVLLLIIVRFLARILRELLDFQRQNEALISVKNINLKYKFTAHFDIRNTCTPVGMLLFNQPIVWQQCNKKKTIMQRQIRGFS